MSRPQIAQATVGFPASAAWWNAQVYTVLNWLYGHVGDDADWIAPPLASGYSGDGNSNGPVQYRIVTLAGAKFVQWRGGLTIGYTNGVLNNGGDFLASPLPSAAWPGGGVVRRTVSVACSASSSSSLSLKVDFDSNGTTTIINGSGVTPPWLSLNNVMYSID